MDVVGRMIGCVLVNIWAFCGGELAPRPSCFVVVLLLMRVLRCCFFLFVVVVFGKKTKSDFFFFFWWKEHQDQDQGKILIPHLKQERGIR